MKKIPNLFVPVCFSALLFLIMAATVLRPMEYTSFYENRDLTAFPELSLEGVMDGSFFTELESFLSDHSAGRNTLLKIKTKADMDIIGRPVVNTVAVTDDYLLPYYGFGRTSDSKVDKGADIITEKIASVNALTKSCGGNFYYVAVPCQSYVQSEKYPWFLESMREEYDRHLESLETKLAEAGVSFIDIGETYDELGNPEYLTSHVDNHFTGYGALATYRTIMEEITEDTGLNLKIYDDDELTFSDMPYYYMGSRTRMLMNLRKNDERVTLIYPKETVSFTRCDNGEQVESSVFRMPEEGVEWATYGVYMGGDIAETVIDTHREELPSILVYGDSFTNGVECIIYNSFNVMRSLDFRHYDDMTLGEYIEKYKPDIVVCIRDYASLLDETGNGTGVDG